jgi:hypothetical protein
MISLRATLTSMRLALWVGGGGGGGGGGGHGGKGGLQHEGEGREERESGVMPRCRRIKQPQRGWWPGRARSGTRPPGACSRGSPACKLEGVVRLLGLGGGGGDGADDCDASAAACGWEQRGNGGAHRLGAPLAASPVLKLWGAVWCPPSPASWSASPSCRLPACRCTPASPPPSLNLAQPASHPPVREPWSRRVSLESRKGMWAALPSLSLWMTVPSVSSDLLMKLPSSRWPRLTSAWEVGLGLGVGDQGQGRKAGWQKLGGLRCPRAQSR